MKKTILIAPTKNELTAALCHCDIQITLNKAPFQVHVGKLGNTDVIAFASGAGSANAALGVSFAALSFQVRDIIFFGIAGSVHEKSDQVYIAESERFLRTGRVSESLKYEPLFGEDMALPKDEISLTPPQSWQERWETGHFGSSDQICMTAEDLTYLKSEFPQIVLENMEGASAALCAKRLGLSLYEVRSISNQVGLPKKSWNIPQAIKGLESFFLWLKNQG
jgi:nucleoside phosphorylase